MILKLCLSHGMLNIDSQYYGHSELYLVREGGMSEVEGEEEL